MEERVQKGAFAVAIAAALATASGHPPRTEPGVRSSSPHSVRQALGSQRRGRPKRFRGPSRAITLTLPEDAIAALQAMDRDISRAVVRTIEPLCQGPRRSTAEVADYGDSAVIIVSVSRNLRERTGVDLVPLADGRALICFDERLTIAEFELRVRDALRDPSFRRKRSYGFRRPGKHPENRTSQRRRKRAPPQHHRPAQKEARRSSRVHSRGRRARHPGCRRDAREGLKWRHPFANHHSLSI